jgi:hypothetical protein
VQRTKVMIKKMQIGALALAAMLCATVVGARAHDEAKYPDLKGQWVAPGVSLTSPWDPTKPVGRGQAAPLTPEYQAIYDATLARQASSNLGPLSSCIPPGMPRAMIAYEPMEIIVMPDTTYIMLAHMSEFRRIYTDDRKWPDDIEPAFAGFSIGKWEDTDGDGRFDTLVVETRGMKGSRTFDGSGIPMHKDNQTIVKERIYLDKADPSMLHNEITTIDNALTKPWTVKRSYRRERDAEWNEYICSEDNRLVTIGEETYQVSDDGYLTPTRQGQPAPDLKYFPSRR